MKVCKYEKKCGGCQLQKMTYTKQLDYKQSEITHLLSKIHPVNPIIKSKPEIYYRNKCQVSFSKDAKGRIHMGNYEESTHRIVDIDDCMINSKLANHIFQTIYDLVKSFHIDIFDEKKMQGFLRHVLIRTNHDDSEAMVVFVSGKKEFPKKKAFIKALLEKEDKITTIIQNSNPRFTSMVLGKKNITIYGKGYIEDILCGMKFRISPTSFYQINHSQCEKMYTYAIRQIDFKKDSRVLDAYCGIGTIGLILSKHAKEVDAVELNKDAIQDAITNAKMNRVKNISFYVDDATNFMVQKAKEKKKYDVVIMDPPRSGASEVFLKSLIQLKPKNVIYISCNPKTQKRDLNILKKYYVVEDIQPFDLFPYTNHIETVVLLSRA